MDRMKDESNATKGSDKDKNQHVTGKLKLATNNCPQARIIRLIIIFMKLSAPGTDSFIL
jgi:hypothetical protein